MFRLLSVKLSLGFFALIFYLPTLCVSLFLPKERRASWWRQMSIVLIRSALFLARVRIKVVRKPETASGQNFIYASNHPSPFDGFVLQAVLGKNVVPFIAPFQQFPYLIALWLRRMGAIDVLRDDIDKARYTHSNTKREALDKAFAVLERGESLLIFPEGHTEMLEALYYFHTGTARLSLATGISIQPIVVKDAHRVFTNTFQPNKNTVTITFEKKVTPDDTYGKDIIFTKSPPLWQKVHDLTQRLENEILNELPLRLITDQRPSASDIGVFVDIDMTIYQGLSQIDFILHLIRTKNISIREGSKIFGLFLREKLGLIAHEKMMQGSMCILAGWNKDAVDKLIHTFFLNIALPKIQYGLFTILEDHLAKGHQVVFVSEAIHPLAQSFADFFEAGRAIDTSLQWRGRTYTGEIQLLRRGKTKAEGVLAFAEEEKIDLQKSYAYADSFTDVDFLILVGNPTAVHPDTKLKRYASLHGMQILKHVS